MSTASMLPWLYNLNALITGLFLLAAFGLVATRQVQGCIRLFVGLSILLACSAILLGLIFHTWHLLVVGCVDIVTKALAVPWILRRSLRREVYTRREVTQVLNIPTALLLALGLAVAAYFIAQPLVAIGGSSAAISFNLPIGLAVLLVGALTSTVRREAVPLLLGLLTMENGAFLAGISVAPEMPLVAEIAIAFDVLVLVLVVGLLTRTVQEHIGTTEVGALTALREEIGE